MRGEVVFSVMVVALIAASGISYFTSTPKVQTTHPGSTGQNLASGWKIVRTNLTVYYDAACIPVEVSYLSCPTVNTAAHSPSLSGVDLISYLGTYYYAVNFTYYLEGQPVTNQIWYTNSTVFCMSPPQPSSGYGACPTEPPRQLGITAPSTPAYALNQALGLELRLSLATDSLTGGLLVNIQEQNMLNRVNNVSASDQWEVPPANLTGVNMGGILGFAIYQGAVDLGSLSAAKPLPLLEPGSMINCPSCSSLQYYLFQPLSDNATAPPGGTFPYYSSSSIRVFLNDTVSGYWTSSTQFGYFPPGAYTVAAFDQWGQVVLSQFEVTE